MAAAKAFMLRSDRGRTEDVLFGLGVGSVKGLLQPQNMKMAGLLFSDGWRFPHLGCPFMEEGPNRCMQRLTSYRQARCEQGVLSIEGWTFGAQQRIALAEVGEANWAHMTSEFPSQSEIAQRVKSAVQILRRGYVP